MSDARTLLVGTCVLLACSPLGAGQSSTITGSPLQHVEYAVDGNPSTAVTVQDGRYLLVSVTNIGGPNYSTPDVEAGRRKHVVSGVQVFEDRNSRLIPVRTVPIGSKGANGMILLPGGNTVVISAGDQGLVFLNVRALIDGTVKPYVLSQGKGAGSWDAVATADGKYIFSANEYGILHSQRGNIGVVALQLNAEGNLVQARTIRQIPAGNKAPRLVLSPDDSRLYVVREILPHGAVPHFAGRAEPLLSKHDCVQILGVPPHANGLLTVIDVQKAVTRPSGEGSILTEEASGCSPVNVIEKKDASALYVTARGDNRILKFSPQLLETDPEHALLGAYPSGGEAPVGLRFLPGERQLVVTNSDRFGEHSGKLSIIDLTGGGNAAIIQQVPCGDFPRNITVSSNGRNVFVNNYASRTLEVITLP